MASTKAPSRPPRSSPAATEPAETDAHQRAERGCLRAARELETAKRQELTGTAMAIATTRKPEAQQSKVVSATHVQGSRSKGRPSRMETERIHAGNQARVKISQALAKSIRSSGRSDVFKGFLGRHR
jgi:hypothetical protein